MTDLVKRLRAMGPAERFKLAHEAADYMEWLEAEVERLTRELERMKEADRGK